MIIYISGMNHGADICAFTELKNALFDLGCTLIIPENKELVKLNWYEGLQLRTDFLHASDAIYMLPTWKESTIAKIELTVAMEKNTPCCFSPEDIKELITTLDS